MFSLGQRLIQPFAWLMLLLIFQNCGQRDLLDEKEGGVLASSLAGNAENLPCQRLAVGLESLGSGEYLLEIENVKEALRLRCLDHTDGRGVYLEVLSNAANLDLEKLFKSPEESFKLTLVIGQNISVGSTSAENPALKTGKLPVGTSLYLINNGRIQGAGGRGGHGGACTTPSKPGQNGGVALELSVPTEIENTGQILGGGGGGGGGGDICQTVESVTKCGGGGAGAGGAGSIPGFTGGFTLPSGTCDMQGGNFPAENGTKDRGGSALGSLAGRGGDPGEPGQDGRSFSGQFTTAGQPGGKAGLGIRRLTSSLIIRSGQNRIKGPISGL